MWRYGVSGFPEIPGIPDEVVLLYGVILLLICFFIGYILRVGVKWYRNKFK